MIWKYKDRECADRKIVCKWHDDKGENHKFKISKPFYSLEGGVWLLSPQHWAQTQADNQLIMEIGSETTSVAVTLYWNQNQDCLTIPLGHENNVGTFQMAPEYKKYKDFCATE